MEENRKPQALDDENLDKVAGGMCLTPDGCFYGPNGKHLIRDVSILPDGRRIGECDYCHRTVYV